MNDKITSLIIDDEQDARDALEMLLKTFLPGVEVLAKAESAAEGIREVIKHQPDLIFLDIKMPGKDGFYVAEELEKLGIETTIIFVTAYDQYAISAIKHAAFDFILKPVDPDELVKAIARYKNMKEKESLKIKIERLHACLRPRQLKFSTQQGFILIAPDEIILCRAEGNYTELFLTRDRKQIVTLQLGKLESQLDSQLFIRISRFCVLNVRYIKSFDRKRKVVELKDENLTELKISSIGLKKLMKL